MIRFFGLKGDPIIWITVFTLLAFSMMIVFGASSQLIDRYDKNIFFYLFKHTGLIVFGFALMYFVHRIDFMQFRKYAIVLIGAAIVLLVLTVFVGKSSNGAQRWLSIPIMESTFQPSDIAKIALIIYLAKILSISQQQVKRFSFLFWQLLCVVFVIFALIVWSDISSAILVFATSWVILFIGRAKFFHLLAVVVLGLSMLFLVFNTGFGQRGVTGNSRISSFMEGEKNKEENYQIIKAKTAIVEGGIFGKWSGKGEEYIPQRHADFIFAHIVEETGLIGGLFTLVLYIILFVRCVKIALKTPNAFGSLIIMGLSINIMLHALCNIGVNLGLLPVTGVVLPLISMGGTSTLFFMISIGIIQSVNAHFKHHKNTNEHAV